MSSPQIPVVDFTPFLDGSAKQQVADQLLASFKSAGFVYLTNFGIPDAEVQEMLDWVRQPHSHFRFLTYITKGEALFCPSSRVQNACASSGFWDASSRLEASSLNTVESSHTSSPRILLPQPGKSHSIHGFWRGSNQYSTKLEGDLRLRE